MSERQAGTYRDGSFTQAHNLALAILSENHVRYQAEQPIQIFGEFDSQGRPVVYKVDILINDPNYSSGIIEIDGEIHAKLRHEKKDERRDHHLAMMKLWVERVPNDDAKNVMRYLEKHRRRVDEYGGVY